MICDSSQNLAWVMVGISPGFTTPGSKIPGTHENLCANLARIPGGKFNSLAVKITVWIS